MRSFISFKIEFYQRIEQIHNRVNLHSLITKFIRIGIADKNDNPPYFDKALYEAEVDENEDIQHTVLTVTAKDHDECK
uniref:CSON004377 protein n=1 Tax=Culicoides sonorensis TaxID=179676 RepID=A0A336MQR6_CULSO